jgi:hypothetical protein
VRLDLAAQLRLDPPDVGLDPVGPELGGPQPGDLGDEGGIVGERVDRGPDRVDERFLPGSHREGQVEPVEPVLVVGEEHLVLAGEVAVEGAGRDAGVGGDVLDAGGVEAVADEAGQRRLAQRRAGPLPSGRVGSAGRTGRPAHHRTASRTAWPAL